jgi:steroid delta-isomerase-like uncharacterized protein
MRTWAARFTFSALLLPAAGSAAAEPWDAKAAVASMTERAWNRGELDVLDTHFADSVVFHYGGEPRVRTRDEMAASIRRWRSAFPDLRMEIHQQVAEGDLVASRMTLSGTQRGTWAGAPPSGRRVTMPLMMMFRFEKGRLVELWEVDDQLSLRRQLGLIP